MGLGKDANSSTACQVRDGLPKGGRFLLPSETEMPTQTTPLANDSGVDGQQHKTCSVCGEAYDAYDLAQYSHHTSQPHARLSDSTAPAD